MRKLRVTIKAVSPLLNYKIFHHKTNLLCFKITINKSTKFYLKYYLFNLNLAFAFWVKLDTNKDGFISIDEAEAAYESSGGVWDSKQQAYFDSCDINGDGKVDFEEFLAKCLEGRTKVKAKITKGENTIFKQIYL